jgi:hypothetical protein
MQDLLMFVSTVAGALAFYLAAPSQRWLRAPLRPRIARPIAGIFLAVALGIAATSGHFATSLCIILITAMAVFVACPFISALLLAGDVR